MFGAGDDLRPCRRRQFPRPVPRSTPTRPAEWDEVEALNTRLIARALAMDGTCTGEHGIGLGKQAALIDELGDGVDLMRQIQTRPRSARDVQSRQNLRAELMADQPPSSTDLLSPPQPWLLFRRGSAGRCSRFCSWSLQSAMSIARS